MNHFSRVIDRSEPDIKRQHAGRLQPAQAFCLLLLCSSINQPSSWHSCKPRSNQRGTLPPTLPPHPTPLQHWHQTPCPTSLPVALLIVASHMNCVNCPSSDPLSLISSPVLPPASPLPHRQPPPPLVFRGEQTKLLIISVMQPLCSALIKGAASGLYIHRQPLG